MLKMSIALIVFWALKYHDAKINKCSRFVVADVTRKWHDKEGDKEFTLIY